MSVTVTVLYGLPNHEIFTKLVDLLQRCERASIIVGFATPDGLESIARPIEREPSKIKHFVVGRLTPRAFDALGSLLSIGVNEDALRVHLGYSRVERNGFARFNPMLHSKLYLFDLPDGTSAAILGSHNLTSFALTGLNGEASVMLEGPSNDDELTKIRQHVEKVASESVKYDRDMSEAYAWYIRRYYPTFPI